MNKVILTGNLCKEIELRKTQNGVSVVTNDIAVQREVKDANGDYQTDFISIVVWGASADYLSKYGEKGARVELCGRLQNRTYLAKDGNNRTITEVQVDYIKVFFKSKKEEEDKEYIEIPDIDDLPF